MQPSQIFKLELFTKKVNGLQSKTTFALGVWKEQTILTLTLMNPTPPNIITPPLNL